MTIDQQRQPSIDEMRRVAKYMADVMGLHSSAGKLLAKAHQLEKLVDELMKLGGADLESLPMNKEEDR